MNASTTIARPPYEPLGMHWLLVALAPPAVLFGWLWASGALGGAGCAVLSALLGCGQ